MPLVLICSETDLDGELGHTLIWRADMSRRLARSAAEARQAAAEAKPDLVVVDRDLAGTEGLIAELRRDSTTRRTSIVVLARSDFDPSEVAQLEAGANAVLRLPPGPDWDERLERLMVVPVRKDVRFPVRLEVETSLGGIQTATATARNLSVNGMLIEATGELQIGTDVDLRFALPDSGAQVQGCGRIVRRAGKNLYGVEFYGLEGDGSSEVRRHLDGLAG